MTNNKVLVVWLLCLFAIIMPANALLNNNLVECYALNDYNDSSNYTINLSIIGEGEIINYITDTDCKKGNCSVNSIYGGLCSDYLGVLGRQEGNINNSMFGWVKIKPGLGLTNQLFLQGSFEGEDTYIILSYDSDYENIYIYSGVYNYIEYAIPLNVSQWYYVGWVYYADNTTIELWIDGNKVSETNIGGLNLDFHNAYSGSCVGAFTYGSGGADFVFDEVAYFEKSLNESEITELYNSSNGFGCIDLVNLEEEGVIIEKDYVFVTGVCPSELSDVMLMLGLLGFGVCLMFMGIAWQARFFGVFGCLLLMVLSWSLAACSLGGGLVFGCFAIVGILWFSLKA